MLSPTATKKPLKKLTLVKNARHSTEFNRIELNAIQATFDEEKLTFQEVSNMQNVWPSVASSQAIKTGKKAAKTFNENLQFRRLYAASLAEAILNSETPQEHLLVAVITFNALVDGKTLARVRRSSATENTGIHKEVLVEIH